MSAITRHRLRSVLSADVGLTVLLVSLCGVLFVVFPFVPLSALGRLLVTIGLTVILVSGSFSLGDRPHLRVIVIGLATVAVVLNWLHNAVPHDAVLAGAYGSTTLFLTLTAAGVLARVMRSTRVTTHSIQGAVAVYLMMGLIWGFAYSLLELHQPGSFNLPGATAAAEGPGDPSENIRELSYFSFVTLTTLGYGEVTPRSSSARTLATLEALVGQLYLVILIASLVSLRVADAQTAGPRRPPPEQQED